MNGEGAETHLRLAAETWLREAMARPAPGSPPAGQERWVSVRLARVAQALSTVHAGGPERSGGGLPGLYLPSHHLSAVDDQGTGYSFGFSGANSRHLI